MILAFDTSSAACTAALFDGEGDCIAQVDERIGRGHAERLVPMLDEMLAGRRVETILVGTGPGSLTGIRVGVAAAHGLAIGWNVQVRGLSSLALIAGGLDSSEAVAAAVLGGHGELFVQEFTGGEATSDLINASPAAAGARTTAQLVAGSGAALLVEARGFGRAVEAWPSARNALRLEPALRDLDPRPLYARAPDAKISAKAKVPA